MTKKLIYGVGYNSRTKYKTFEFGKRTRAYRYWYSMLERCYSLEHQKKRPSYIGCSVAKEWHDFQDFADWFHSHPYSDADYALDKDILFQGNRVYSSKSCCFVPLRLNTLLISCGAARGGLPQGVNLHKATNRYRATLQVNGKPKHLGLFDCVEQAHKTYKVAKEAYVKQVANEWRGRIAEDVFSALSRWSLTDE